MSEKDKSAQTDASKASISYEMFQAFYKGNPDLDNAEYYQNFPTVNAGTIRSWKAKAKKDFETPQSNPQPTPPKEEKTNMKEIIDLLIPATGIDPNLLTGMDETNQVAFLKNLMTQKNKSRDPNMPLLPTTAGTGKTKFGIEKFATFNPTKGVIKVVIPASIAHDPKKSEILRQPI